MTSVNPENLIGSTKRQVAVGDVRPWPEIVFQVKFHDPLWIRLLLLLLAAFASVIGYGVAVSYAYNDLPAAADWIFLIALIALGAAVVFTLLRLLLRKSWYRPRVNAVALQGLGDVCVITEVRKSGWLMQFPEQMRALNIIAIEGGFRKRGSIGRLILPNCTERLGDGLLRGCKHLACIHLPDRLKAVPPALMEKCPRLQAVVIPAAAESIGARAFAGCKRLKDVYITAATTQIAEDAFLGCQKLMFHVQEASEAERYARQHNINYSYH